VQSERARALKLSSALNATVRAADLERIAAPDGKGRRLLEAAMNQLGLSARAYGKILRVARTIADLEGDERVLDPHVAEAIQSRMFDREALPG
jgi:magnesium chelatase family protein